jgi:hypothetical protein
MAPPLFSFGTLRDPELFAAVVGRPLGGFAVETAHLPGHAAEYALGMPYPVLVPAPGERLAGLVIAGLAAIEIERIQFYETLEYELRPVIVEVGGRARPARSFFASTRLAASGARWRLEDWQATAKPEAVAMASAAMRFFGRIALAEINERWPEIERLAEAARAEDGGAVQASLTGLAPPP